MQISACDSEPGGRGERKMRGANKNCENHMKMNESGFLGASKRARLLVVDLFRSCFMGPDFGL